MGGQLPGVGQIATVCEAGPRRPVAVLSSASSLWSWIRRYAQRCVRGWWAWELISAMVSVLAMGALIVVLAVEDKHQQHTWAVGKTELTLNAVVAAIGTVIRGSLLLMVAGSLNQNAWNWFASKKDAQHGGRPLEDFETFSDAAANSWNCLKLLWRTKFRHLASIGALITILSIAFDVFLQQILTTGADFQAIQLSGDNLTLKNVLPHTLSYERNNSYDYDDVEELLLGKTIVMNGILNVSNAFPDADCPGLECTWPVTPTVGVCSQCVLADYTAELVSNTTCNSTVYTLSAPLNTTLRLSTCNFSGLLADESSWRTEVRTLNWPMTPYEETYRALTGEYNTSPVASLYFLGPTRDTVTEGHLAQFNAYTCNIYMCVRGYTAISTQGAKKQETVPLTTKKAHYEPDNGDGWWVFENVPRELNSGPTTTFRVAESLRFTLGSVLYDVLAVSGKGSNRDGTLDGTTALSVWQASTSLARFSSMVESISDTWTTHIRTTNPTQTFDARYAPVAQVSIQLVQVRWVWLAYPLALQLGSFIFLALTMYTTSLRNVRPWKGHRVPLLLAHLDDTVRTQALGGVSNRTGLEDRVGSVRVRIEFDGHDGIAFRRVHGSPTPV